MLKVLSLFTFICLTGNHGWSQSVKATWLNETSVIKLVVSHGGGCRAHEWGIALTGRCTRSLPPKCDAELVHLEGHDDFCEAIITTESTVKLTSHPFNDYILNIKNRGESLAKVRITTKATTPPTTHQCVAIDESGKKSIYKPGDSFPDIDGCNTCGCGPTGHIACTELACAGPVKCKSQNRDYRIGESFRDKDGCNTCSCTNRGIVCTEMYCGGN